MFPIKMAKMAHLTVTVSGRSVITGSTSYFCRRQSSRHLHVISKIIDKGFTAKTRCSTKPWPRSATNTLSPRSFWSFLVGGNKEESKWIEQVASLPVYDLQYHASTFQAENISESERQELNVIHELIAALGNDATDTEARFFSAGDRKKMAQSMCIPESQVNEIVEQFCFTSFAHRVLVEKKEKEKELPKSLKELREACNEEMKKVDDVKKTRNFVAHVGSFNVGFLLWSLEATITQKSRIPGIEENVEYQKELVELKVLKAIAQVMGKNIAELKLQRMTDNEKEQISLLAEVSLGDLIGHIEAFCSMLSSRRLLNFVQGSYGQKNVDHQSVRYDVVKELSEQMSVHFLETLANPTSFRLSAKAKEVESMIDKNLQLPEIDRAEHLVEEQKRHYKILQALMHELGQNAAEIQVSGLSDERKNSIAGQELVSVDDIDEVTDQFLFDCCLQRLLWKHVMLNEKDIPRSGIEVSLFLAQELASFGFYVEQERKLKTFKARMEAIASLKNYTLANRKTELETTNALLFAVEGLETESEMFQAHLKNYKILKALEKSLGINAGIGELKDLSQLDKLRAASGADTTLKELNAFLSQFDTICLVQKMLRKKKHDGKTLPSTYIKTRYMMDLHMRERLKKQEQLQHRHNFREWTKEWE